jgi:hypothetical protein
MRKVGNWIAEQAVVAALVANGREAVVGAFKMARNNPRGLESSLAALEHVPLERYEELRSALMR